MLKCGGEGRYILEWKKYGISQSQSMAYTRFMYTKFRNVLQKFLFLFPRFNFNLRKKKKNAKFKTSYLQITV